MEKSLEQTGECQWGDRTHTLAGVSGWRTQRWTLPRGYLGRGIVSEHELLDIVKL